MASPKLASALKKAKALGRGGDTMLAHINPKEADILKSLGGSGTINPHTGLPEFDNPSMGSYDGAGDTAASRDPTGWGGSSNYSGGNNYSNYIGGSDLGGYKGSGNTTYSSGGSNSLATARTADRASVAGYSADPVSPNAYQIGSDGNTRGLSSFNTSPSHMTGASGFANALSAGAGKVASFGDTLSGIFSSAQPAISSFGNRVADNMISMSDTLNQGLSTGYGFAKDYISNALSPSVPQGPSYTQMAALSGPSGLGVGAESAVSNPPASSSFPNIASDIADPNSYMGGGRLVGYEGSGNTVYSNFGNLNDTPAPTRASMREFLDRQNANLPAATASPSSTAPINPDVSYGLRFNPGTIANAEYIKGAQIKDQFPNVNFGGLSNTEVGRIVTRSIAGEAAREGDLGQQLVASNIMNRLALADQGLNSEGKKQSLSFKDVMKGYDANGFDTRRTGPANSVYNNPSASTELSAFNAMSAALSPNAAINQARTNPMAAMEIGAQYGVAPELVANAVQSTHYYNPRYASPSWGQKMTNTAQIGGHLFGNLNTSQNAAQAMNGLMTGFNIPSSSESPDIIAPNAVIASSVPAQYVPDRPVTPTPPTAYGSDLVNPVGYDAPLTLPALPNTALGKVVDVGIGLTPLGIPNTVAGLFGYSAGDQVANAANVPMTVEEAQAAQEQMFASRSSDNGGRDVQTPSSKDLVRQTQEIIKASKKPSVRWKLDALAWGFSEEQLADSEVADLIKQVYDLGFIPKTA